MNNFSYVNPAANQYGIQQYQQTQYFPQPQGNVYIINNSLEVANVPMGSGISVGFCPNENLIYFKTLQNGNPSVLAYTLTPYEQKKENSSLEERIKLIEEKLNIKGGGKLSELI